MKCGTCQKEVTKIAGKWFHVDGSTKHHVHPDHACEMVDDGSEGKRKRLCCSICGQEKKYEEPE